MPPLHWCRFGASSLANDILMQSQKEADGHYWTANYFSVDEMIRSILSRSFGPIGSAGRCYFGAHPHSRKPAL